MSKSARPWTEGGATAGHVAAALAFLAWLAKVVALWSLPLRALAMTPWLLDDSFIFMRIARNVALGLGYSFDGRQATTGAPPLWVLLCAPFHLVAGPEVAAKLTLALSAAFAAASALLVFHLARARAGPEAAWLAFLFVLVAPAPALNGLNGMETALFTSLALGATSLHARLAAPAAARHHLALGALGGLTVLARADGALFALVLGLERLRAARRAARSEGGAWSRRLALEAAAALLLAAPLFAFDLAVDGNLLPANQAGRHRLAWEFAAGPGAMSLPAYLRQVGSNLREAAGLLAAGIGSVLAAAAAVLLVRRTPAAPLARLAALYLALHVGLLVLYQGYLPDVHGLRYLNLEVHLLAVAVGAGAVEAGRRLSLRPGRRRLALAGLGALLAGAAVLRYQGMVDRLYWARGLRVLPVYAPAEVDRWWSFLDWARARLPDGTAVAAKDVGRLAYFTGTRVVDLAGIVDPELNRCLDRGRIGDYLAAREVRLAVLPTGRGFSVHRAIARVCRLEPVISAPPQELTGYRLYAIACPAAAGEGLRQEPRQDGPGA